MFQSFLCQGLAPHVLRSVLSSIGNFREFSVQYEKDDFVERCFVLYWDDKDVKKICVGSESLEQVVPSPELIPLARVVCSLDTNRMPMAVLGASPCLVRVLEDNRADGHRFVVFQGFDEEVLFRCTLQADRDVFGMVSVTTLVEYLAHRLKSALFEDWTAGISRMSHTSATRRFSQLHLGFQTALYTTRYLVHW